MHVTAFRVMSIGVPDWPYPGMPSGGPADPSVIGTTTGTPWSEPTATQKVTLGQLTPVRDEVPGTGCAAGSAWVAAEAGIEPPINTDTPRARAPAMLAVKSRRPGQNPREASGNDRGVGHGPPSRVRPAHDCTTAIRLAHGPGVVTGNVGAARVDHFDRFFAHSSAMAVPVAVRDITNEEGRRLLTIVRRGSGSVVRWRRAQIVLWSAQRIDPHARRQTYSLSWSSAQTLPDGALYLGADDRPRGARHPPGCRGHYGCGGVVRGRVEPHLRGEAARAQSRGQGGAARAAARPAPRRPAPGQARPTRSHGPTCPYRRCCGRTWARHPRCRRSS